jgi:predicted ATPase
VLLKLDLASAQCAYRGNPFLIEELLRGVQHPSQLDRAANLPVPRTIRDAVQRRVEGLSEDARTPLVQASILGRRFDFPQLSSPRPSALD